MLNIDKINSIILLLNLELKEVPSGYQIIDYTQKTINDIKYNGEYYEYTYTRNNNTYHMYLNSKGIIFQNSLNETASIIFDSFIYSEKNPKDETNISQITIDKNGMSFYLKTMEKDNDGYVSNSIRVYNVKQYYTFFKQSTDIQKNGLIKTDTTIYDEDDGLIEKTVTRNYSPKGKLVDPTTQMELYEATMNEYVKEKLNSQEFIIELLTRVDNFIPGIIEYLKRINENVADIKGISKLKRK